MPSYNGEKYIGRSINNFLSQEYPNKELIIVDGKSTDRSHAIIQSFVEKNKNIIWLKYPDKGISSALNIGLEKVSGDIIGYLGSDDILSPDIFGTINDYANKTDFDAIYFDSYNFIASENKTTFRKCPNMEFNRKNLLKYGTMVGMQDMFFKKHVFLKYKFDEENKYSLDYEFYLKISKENYKYLYVPVPATTHIFDNNISTDADGKQMREASEVFKKYAHWYERHYQFTKKMRGYFKKILLMLKFQ